MLETTALIFGILLAIVAFIGFIITAIAVWIVDKKGKK
jgi:hypothetical protein